MSPPSASPVAKYIISVFVGSIKISETPNTGKLSVFVVQLSPPSIVFQSPPPGAPIQNILASVG